MPAGNFPGGTADGRISLGISSNTGDPDPLRRDHERDDRCALEHREEHRRREHVVGPLHHRHAAAELPWHPGNQYTYIAVDPTNPNTVFAAGSYASTSATGQQLNSIIESTNGGATWTDISAGINGNGPTSATMPTRSTPTASCSTATPGDLATH